MQKSLLSLALLATLAGTAQASESQFGLQLEGALENGGDDYATVFFTDGSTQDISVGQGGSLAIGAHYRPNEFIDFVGTVGYKFVTTAAENSDIGIDRTVLKLEGRYNLGSDFWFGGGVTQHTNITFDGGGMTADRSFDNATGAVITLGWKWVALSYTDIQYRDESRTKYDASNIGLMLSAGF